MTRLRMYIVAATGIVLSALSPTGVAAQSGSRTGADLLWLQTAADLTPQHDALVAVSCRADTPCRAAAADIRLNLVPASLFRCSRHDAGTTVMLQLSEGRSGRILRREISAEKLQHGLVVQHWPEPGRYVRVVLMNETADRDDTPRIFAVRPPARMRIKAPIKAARFARERGLPG